MKKYVKIDTDIANEAWVNNPNCIAVIVYLALRGIDKEGQMQLDISLAAMQKDLGISRDALRYTLALLEKSKVISRLPSVKGRNSITTLKLIRYAELDNGVFAHFCTLNQLYTQFYTQFSTQFFGTISELLDLITNGCKSECYDVLSEENKTLVDTMCNQFNTQFNTQLKVYTQFYTQFNTQFFGTIRGKIDEYLKHCGSTDCKEVAELFNIDKSTMYNQFITQFNTQLSTLQRDKEDKKKKEKETREESLSPCIPFDKVENKDKEKEKEKEEKEKAYRRYLLYNNTQARENFVEEEAKRSPAFIPPTLEEIREHFALKGYPEQAEPFYYFYESKGWFVGKTKMKKWKMAAAGWITRTVNPVNGHNQPQRPIVNNPNINNQTFSSNGQQQPTPTPSRQQLANDKLRRDIAQRCADLLNGSDKRDDSR